MTDLALHWDADTFSADLAIVGGDLSTDEGLRTAFLISLFTDARARDDDELPEPGADRRGWWGDAFSDPEDGPTGSRFWLLDRAKSDQRTLARAKDYAAECVQWLIRAGICTSIGVEVEAQAGGRLAIAYAPVRPTGPARERYDFLWEGSMQ